MCLFPSSTTLRRGRWTTDGEMLVEPYRVVPPAAPAGYVLPSDPAERLPLALEHLDGWVEAVLALLRYVICLETTPRARDAGLISGQIPHIKTCAGPHCSDRCCRTTMPEPHSRHSCQYPIVPEQQQLTFADSTLHLAFTPSQPCCFPAAYLDGGSSASRRSSHEVSRQAAVFCEPMKHG